MKFQFILPTVNFSHKLYDLSGLKMYCLHFPTTMLYWNNIDTGYTEFNISLLGFGFTLKFQKEVR